MSIENFSTKGQVYLRKEKEIVALDGKAIWAAGSPEVEPVIYKMGVDGSIPLGELCSPSLHIKVPLGKMPSPELTSKYPSECECQCVRMFIKCLDAEKSSLYKAVLVVQVYMTGWMSLVVRKRFEHKITAIESNNPNFQFKIIWSVNAVSQSRIVRGNSEKLLWHLHMVETIQEPVFGFFARSHWWYHASVNRILHPKSILDLMTPPMMHRQLDIFKWKSTETKHNNSLNIPCSASFQEIAMGCILTAWS